MQNNLQQANQREESYKEQIKTLTTKLKQVTSAAEPGWHEESKVAIELKILQKSRF